MIHVMTHVSKYVVAILVTLYTIRCFTAFGVKKERRKKRIYRAQNTVMLLIHFVLYCIIFLNQPTVFTIALYLAQLVFFLVALFLYSSLYRDASKMLINNMFFLMMVGFVVLARLDTMLAFKQFVIAVGAVILSLFIPVFIEKARFLSHLGYVYGIAGLATIGLVFVFGESVYGATNWVNIAGIGFQPSEIAKIIFVFFVASMLYKRTDLKRIMVTSVIAAIHVLLLVAEKDLGAAVIFFVTYLFMLYVATQQIIWPFLGITGGGIASVGAYFAFGHVRRRVTAWRHPWENYEDAGYQICQSLFAIGTGSWFGMGLFEGTPMSIPVRESDFIFSVISEEMGGIVAVCLILIFMSNFIMFINISLKLTNNFYKILAVGLSISYGFQVFLSVGGVIKMIPHTGVTLPLISYGGSSILSTIFVFAVIQGLYLLKQKEVNRSEGK